MAHPKSLHAKVTETDRIKSNKILEWKYSHTEHEDAMIPCSSSINQIKHEFKMQHLTSILLLSFLTVQCIPLHHHLDVLFEQVWAHFFWECRS